MYERIMNIGYSLQLNSGKTLIILWVLQISYNLQGISINGLELTKSICVRFVNTTESRGININQSLTLKPLNEHQFAWVFVEK